MIGVAQRLEREHALRARARPHPFGTRPREVPDGVLECHSPRSPVVQAILPIDVTALLSVFMGISIVLIPVLGITARFALKPTVEALSRFFDKKGSNEAVSILERRMAFMEQQLESIKRNVQRLMETADFDRKLAAPTEHPAQVTGPNSHE